MQKIRHIEAVARLNYILAKSSAGSDDVIEIGEELVDMGLDKITDGFWVWEVLTNREFFSPDLRRSLGFEDESDFPNVPESWQKQINPDDRDKALIAFDAHLKDPASPYYLEVTYRKKHGGHVHLVCAGTIVNRNNPDKLIMLGTHKIISHREQL